MSDQRGPRCPTCASDVPARESNAFFPFCSKACRLADLGQWLDGGYRIPQDPSDEDLEELEAASRSSDTDDGL